MSSSAGKVLIVDDEPTIRWVLTEALRSHGYEPYQAASAFAARSAFENLRPDAVLLDINLPDGSGLQLLREFKELAPHTVIIIMTAEVILQYTLEALHGHADDFIGKPIDLSELLTTLGRGLSSLSRPYRAPHRASTHLMIVTDSQERLTTLRSAVASGHMTSVTSADELRAACEQHQDLAIIDLPPEHLPETLRTIRASDSQKNIPVLVALSRITDHPEINCLLSQYRAMPCSPAELVTLARLRLAASDPDRNPRLML